MRPLRTLLTVRDDECKFVIGEPCGAQTLFCSDPTVAGKSYCAQHAALVYRKSTPAEDRAFQALINECAKAPRAKPDDITPPVTERFSGQGD